MDRSLSVSQWIKCNFKWSNCGARRAVRARRRPTRRAIFQRTGTDGLQGASIKEIQKFFGFFVPLPPRPHSELICSITLTQPPLLCRLFNVPLQCGHHIWMPPPMPPRSNEVSLRPFNYPVLSLSVRFRRKWHEEKCRMTAMSKSYYCDFSQPIVDMVIIHVTF